LFYGLFTYALLDAPPISENSLHLLIHEHHRSLPEDVPEDADAGLARHRETLNLQSVQGA